METRTKLIIAGVALLFTLVFSAIALTGADDSNEATAPPPPEESDVAENESQTAAQTEQTPDPSEDEQGDETDDTGEDERSRDDFSEDELEASKEVALSFVEVYGSFDIDNHEKH